jgi:hypothetical protein
MHIRGTGCHAEAVICRVLNIRYPLQSILLQ